jgi:acetyl esterase/lipase
LHGGAYALGSAHPRGGAGAMIAALLEKTESVNRLFSLEYRLSSSAPFPTANPFPAALIDAVTGYNHLVSDLGFDPNNIIVIGDSAGGHLALSLIMYLVETSVLPVPGKFIGNSPLCDITSSHLTVPDPSLKFESDIITRIDKGVYEWALVSFAGPLQGDPNDGPAKNPYLSPAAIGSGMGAVVSFKGFPDTFLVSGGAERMRDELRTLKQRMVRDLGEGKVTAHEGPDGVHCFTLYPWDDPGKTEALRLLSEWVDEK